MLCAIETGTSDGSLIAASDTNCTPWAKPSAASAARAIANLVLPQPPGPVNVSSLLSWRRFRAWAISYSLPTKLVRGRGRRLRTGPVPPAAVPNAANSSSEGPVIDGHHTQCTPIATSALSWRIGIPTNPTRISAIRTSFADGQLTLPMLSSSRSVPTGDRPLIAPDRSVCAPGDERVVSPDAALVSGEDPGVDEDLEVVGQGRLGQPSGSVSSHTQASALVCGDHRHELQPDRIGQCLEQPGEAGGLAEGDRLAQQRG